MTAEPIKILLVEDESIIYRNIRDFFIDNGFIVLAHPEKEYIDNYDDAVLVCKNIPHIAILDIEIKGKKNGFEIAKYVKRHFYSPIIFFTGNTNAPNRTQARKLAAGGFVKKSVKPYDEQQLYEDVQRLLPYAQFANTMRTETIMLNLQEHIGREFVARKVELKKLMFIDTSVYGKNYVTLHLQNRKSYQYHSSLREMEKLLPPYFLKVDSGMIINSRFIKQGGRSPWQFIFNNRLVEISTTYRTDHTALVLEEVKFSS